MRRLALQAITAHSMGEYQGVIGFQHLVDFLQGGVAVLALRGCVGLLHYGSGRFAERVPLLREGIVCTKGSEVHGLVARGSPCSEVVVRGLSLFALSDQRHGLRRIRRAVAQRVPLAVSAVPIRIEMSGAEFNSAGIMILRRERGITVGIDLAGEGSDVGDIVNHARQRVAGYRDRHRRDGMTLTRRGYLPDP